MTSSPHRGPAAREAVREAYRDYVRRAYREEFGVRDLAVADRVADQWFHADARHDGLLKELRARRPGARRILDVASGMGAAVLRARAAGLEAWGVEPDAVKAALVARRIDCEAEGGEAFGWRARALKASLPRAVGEALPFKDASFDAVLSYQTLEHVADPERVLAEMLRVTRRGGALHLRCPDYRGTFEGHYLLPWLPWLPLPLARLYLRALRRPIEGLKTIRYVSGPRIARMIRKAAARSGRAATITDLETLRYRERLRAAGLPGWRGPSPFWTLVYHAHRAFRKELTVNLWVELD